MASEQRAGSFVIRREVLDTIARAEFERRLVRHLAEVLGLSPDRLAAEVPGAVRVAAEYAITRECDVARYCELLYQAIDGAMPDRLPKPAQNILLAYGVAAADRLERFAAWLAEAGAGVSHA